MDLDVELVRALLATALDTDAGRTEARDSSIEQLRKEAPHAEVVELKDTDHFCFIQREDEVVRRMRQFLLDKS